MNLRQSSAVRVGVLVATVTASIAVEAGGVKSRTSAHSGRQVAHHGVAIFNRNTRNLPDGVGIFHRRPPAAHTHSGKYREPGRGDRRRMSGSRHSKRGVAPPGKGDRIPVKMERRSSSNHPKNERRERGGGGYGAKMHGPHGKKQVFYGSTVYVQTPAQDLYYPEESDEERCRSLTERGYDLSGRRVLVEWTLCFDEQGEAYVPEGGRQIVARY